jgi:hypothetical protein
VEPTVFLAAVSPITIGLIAAAVTLTLIAGGHVILAVSLGVAVWISRVLLARVIARRVRGLPRRVDPFALREPWRFYVRDAMQARNRFADGLSDAADGPLRTRLVEIGERIDSGVEHCWEVAQKGQRLTDARRKIDIERLGRELENLTDGDARRSSVEAQIASHDRVAAREQSTQEQLEQLDVRLDEAVVRAIELGTRAGELDEISAAGAAVDAVVDELEALRSGLDDVRSIR